MKARPGGAGETGVNAANEPEETLCWECANANGNGCGWFKRHAPVRGWVAEKIDIDDNENLGESFRVRGCSEFKRGKAARGI